MSNYVEQFHWVNHHQTVDVSVRRLYNIWNRNADGTKPGNLLDLWKAGIARIQDALHDAEIAADAPKVRALGGSWSLSAAAETDGYLIATQSLDIVDVGLFPEDFDNTAIIPENMLLAQCGASVRRINNEVALKGLCLPTTGASDGQTIIGAISTGTHGSAHKVGAMQECVRGIHLITDSKTQYWIEPSRRIVSDSFLNDLMPGVIRKNDDALFNATIVSFGSFGIIHVVLLESEPLYHLEVWQNYYPWKELQAYLTKPTEITPFLRQKTGDNLDANLLHHVQMVVNPYNVEPDDTVILLTIFKRPGAPPKRNRTSPTFDSSDLYMLIGVFADLLPVILPDALKEIIRALDGSVKSKYPPLAGETYLHRDFFTGGKFAVSAKGMSIEIGTEVENASKVMDILLDQAQITEFPGVIGVRYVKQSVATLAFTRFALTACFEILSPACHQTQEYYDQILLRLEEENIPFALHWGQMNDYSDNGAAKVRQRWGDKAVNDWLEARAQILNNQSLLDRFSNQMLENCGLNVPLKSNPVIAAVDI